MIHTPPPQKHKDELRLLRNDIERAASDLASDVAAALRALGSFDRDIVHDHEALQELHDAVSVAIEDALYEFNWRLPRLLRQRREAGL